MRRLPICLLGSLLLSLSVAYPLDAQEKSGGSTTSGRTFRPVVRGTQYAVSSMKQEATRAASRILESGGNAFDAIVAGQAVLALVNPEDLEIPRCVDTADEAIAAVRDLHGKWQAQQ